MTAGYVQITFIFLRASSSLLVSFEVILQQYQKYTVYDYMQLRRIAVTFLNIRLMYK